MARMLIRARTRRKSARRSWDKKCTKNVNSLMLLVGVEGGATHTQVCVADALTGRVLGRKSCGATNVLAKGSASATQVAEEIVAAIRAVVSTGDADTVAAVCLSLSGCGSAAPAAEVRAAFSAAWNGAVSAPAAIRGGN